MAGNNQSPESWSAPEQGPSGSKPSGKTFSCTNCGASITVRYMGHSLRVICESCKSTLDARDENLRIIEKHFNVTKEFTPKLKLGSRGKLKGREWEVIGFVVRQDVLSYYMWEEYLLFNPYYGYRFLALNNGHWSFVSMLKEKPETHSKYFTGKTSTNASFDDDNYKLYFLGKAKIFYVLGEFYWNVKVGDEVSVADYVCPPYMLSMEGDKTEQVWSRAEYISQQTIEEEFKPEANLPYAVGVAPNQPSKFKGVVPKVMMMWIAFTVIAFCIQFVHLSTSHGKIAFQKQYQYQANVKNPTITTPVFELTKPKNNVEVHFYSYVDNSWLYVYSELVNDETDATYSFEKTIEYYHGYSGGESWTEGSRTRHVFIPSVPPGKYYLNLYTQSGDWKKLGTKTYDVRVRRGVGTWASFMWTIFFLGILPVSLLVMHHSEEVARWSDSDFSPYGNMDE